MLSEHSLEKANTIYIYEVVEKINCFLFTKNKKMSTIYEKSLEKHKEYQWKLWTHIKVPMNTKEDLSTYYSPWVAAPCLAIAKNADDAYIYTSKSNTVAVISDGSAVLWLGNIWGSAWLPVMEGKSILMKRFANVDSVPVILKTQDTDQIIQTIVNISPTYGAINLEDISAPRCFQIEEKLQELCDIPVFHDDQHGTAIIVLAGLINSLKITNKKSSDCKVVMVWAGAAGTAIAKLLYIYGFGNIVMIDTKWAIHKDRKDLNKYKEQISLYNRDSLTWELEDVIKWADVFVWVSQPNLLTPEMVKSMNTNPVIFALANPDPEILPNIAKEAGAKIVATGRSDYPNQVNNVLAFPGIFRGLLDARIRKITDAHKLAAANAIANYISNPDVDHILPDVLDEWIANAVAEAVKSVW